MTGKIKLATVLTSVLLVVLGALYLQDHISFYKKAQKTKAVINNMDNPDFCRGARYCLWSRKVTFQFVDPYKSTIKESQELFTPTLISGALTTGGSVSVLYALKPVNTDILDRLSPNIGTKVYDVKIYTWHYWAYPILLILFGPLLYWIVKKLSEKRIQN